MAHNAPTIMISSTFYDLRQIRQDLAHFLEKELGYNVLASEFASFPIDPDVDTIENCRRRVEKEADVLVLIIGGRYGYVDKKSSKSITNIEYLTARAKGIPIYAFVDKGILPLLPVWEKSPRAKFGDSVLDTKVFEFIQKVRSVDKVWMQEFDYAQTIVHALRIQFAHLMNEGLKARLRLNENRLGIPTGISGKAMRLALEQPAYWEYYLFAQVLTDEVLKHTDLYQQHQRNILSSTGERINRHNGLDWITDRFDELSRIVQTLSDIINEQLLEALGPPGLPGDANLLSFTARKVADVYFQALEWSQRVRHVYAPNQIRPLISELVTFPNDLIEQLKEYGPRVTSEIDKVQLTPKGSFQEIEIMIKPDLKIKPGFEDRLRRSFLHYDESEE